MTATHEEIYGAKVSIIWHEAEAWIIVTEAAPAALEAAAAQDPEVQEDGRAEAMKAQAQNLRALDRTDWEAAYQAVRAAYGSMVSPTFDAPTPHPLTFAAHVVLKNAQALTRHHRGRI